MLNIFIAEDEPLAAAKLKLFLEKLRETNVLVLDNGLSLLAKLAEQQPDVLFLDIQMPGATGMQVMNRMQELKIQDTQIIITSAYEQYALDSFNYNVTDYLLKPYTLERLKTALEKARTNIRLKDLDKKNNTETISIRSDGRTFIIPLAEIICIESIKDYVRIITTDGKRRMTLCTLSSLEQKLPSYFTRIHRSYIINLRHIIEFAAQSVVMAGGIEIAVGKTYREQFEKLTAKK